MGHEVTIGGERLGTGNRMKTYLRNYERSTHDLSYIWRSTMSAGTLVPFMVEVALPGDTFDINLDVDVLTHPTIGPLFGSYKVQLDVFQIPIRLYNGKLHMNLLNIGLDMSQIKLPQMHVITPLADLAQPMDKQGINPSHLLSYLNIRGVGYETDPGSELATQRDFNAVPYLAYWDIYKNYYANKQEEIGAMIHRSPEPVVVTITTCTLYQVTPTSPLVIPTSTSTNKEGWLTNDSTITIIGTGFLDADVNNFEFYIAYLTSGSPKIWEKLTNLFTYITVLSDTTIVASIPINPYIPQWWDYMKYDGSVVSEITKPRVVTFDLSNIDDMRKNILADVNSVSAFYIDAGPDLPYNGPLYFAVDPDPELFCTQFNQEGLALKTYQSDLFNNWLDTEWIDGVDGISAVTAVDTSGGSFTIDELNLSKKVYDMLNRIAISGGTYDDWLDAVYSEDRTRSAENPMYIGGLMTNLVFQEVISNAATETEPLGTLAGRGRIGSKRKGGTVVAKIQEPSYLMGIVSLTPIVDYSQGNKWDTNLKTMNDLHKPALDAIGFQDLITDQMAWWDTLITNGGEPVFKSAGKQPAWINYMTNVNQVRGNFADQTQQMFMVLNRRYEVGFDGSETSINDLTTYIDPSKFNHIFADTRIDAQNFWTQISVDITARRKMSAKVIPNL